MAVSIEPLKETIVLRKHFELDYNRWFICSVVVVCYCLYSIYRVVFLVGV